MELARTMYAEEVARLSKAREGDDIGDGAAVLARASDYVAVLAVVGRILDRLKVPAWRDDVETAALRALAGTVAKADRPTEALAAVYAWCCERPESFWGRHRESKDGRSEQPLGAKWSGAWSNRVGWAWIGINESMLREVLKARGFDVEATLQTWDARGWTVAQSETRKGADGKPRVIRRPSIVAKVGDVATRCVAIQRDALNKAGILAGAETVDGEETHG
jgi:hypothetical protein